MHVICASCAYRPAEYPCSHAQVQTTSSTNFCSAFKARSPDHLSKLLITTKKERSCTSKGCSISSHCEEWVSTRGLFLPNPTKSVEKWGILARNSLILVRNTQLLANIGPKVGQKRGKT